MNVLLSTDLVCRANGGATAYGHDATIRQIAFASQSQVKCPVPARLAHHPFNHGGDAATGYLRRLKIFTLYSHLYESYDTHAEHAKSSMLLTIPNTHPIIDFMAPRPDRKSQKLLQIYVPEKLLPRYKAAVSLAGKTMTEEMIEHMEEVAKTISDTASPKKPKPAK